MEKTLKIDNCMDCPHHLVRPDPDPDDWFCDDDEKVVCTQVQTKDGTNETESMNSKSKKLWWHGTRGVDNPTRLRKHYDIWWIPIREFDCYGG